jgi:hypothetical protein
MNAARILDIFIHTISSQIKVPLGRWNIHNHKETMLKFKYANEDNCGISGNNLKNIKQMQTNNVLDNDNNNQYIYMMGYESAHK